jgi:hypothetical protein
MKKMVTVLGLSLMCTTLLGGVTAFADEVGQETTTASAEFTAPDPGGEDGPLTLDRVDNLEFGSREISKVDQSYSAASESVIEVADLRGTLEGWHLVVSQTPMLSSVSNTELAGISINLRNGVVESSSEDTKIEIGENIEITPTDEKILVMNAENGQGNGVTKAKFNKNDIKLNVPGGKALAEQYESTMTWTLLDAPN